MSGGYTTERMPRGASKHRAPCGKHYIWLLSDGDKAHRFYVRDASGKGLHVKSYVGTMPTLEEAEKYFHLFGYVGRTARRFV